LPIPYLERRIEFDTAKTITGLEKTLDCALFDDPTARRQQKITGLRYRVAGLPAVAFAAWRMGAKCSYS
jgi:hypothetical protein